MAYTPSTLTLSNWTVPLSVNSSDNITDLDDTVNAILDTNASSAKNHINAELAKIPSYLSSELTTMYGNLGESMAHKWAEEAEDVEVATGEYSAHHWAIKTAEFLSGITVTYTELNVLDGATLSTTELNILDGVTASTSEINILDGLTASTAELNILDGVTASTSELNLLDGITALSAGSYLPTVTAGINLTSVTARKCLYYRIGNFVYVSGGATVTPTTASTDSALVISLPFTPSIFGDSFSASGTVATDDDTASGVISAYTFFNTAVASFISDTSGSPISIRFSFMYEIDYTSV